MPLTMRRAQLPCSIRTWVADDASIREKHSCMSVNRSLGWNPRGALRTLKFRSAESFSCKAVAVFPRAESRITWASLMNCSKSKKDVTGAHSLVRLFTTRALATIQSGCASDETGPCFADSGCINSIIHEIEDHA